MTGSDKGQHPLKTVYFILAGLAVAALLLVSIALAPLRHGKSLLQFAHAQGGPMAAAVNVLDADLIRVGISDDNMTDLEYPSTLISANGAFRIIAKQSGILLFQGAPQQIIHITKSASGFIINPAGMGQLATVQGDLRIEPVNPDTTLLRIPSVSRKGVIPSYRGVLEITPGYSAPNKFSVVNVLPMQDYLKAVVPNELPSSYGYEAVKAQAVAARNYAIHPREKPWPQFDICDSQYCQAYYGANTENPQTTKALLETQGLVALYKGNPILALYSSSHGGYSENYENAFSDPGNNQFPGTPVPYLRGEPDEPESLDLSQEGNARRFYTDKNAPSYDVLSPYYRWQRTWTHAQLENTLNKTLPVLSRESFTKAFIQPQFPAGQKIGALQSLTVTQRGVSGKAMVLVITGSKGTWTLKKEFVIRKALQTQNKFLPSANVVFDLVKDDAGKLQSIRALGGGFGHGVGMSQIGASFMDKQLHQHFVEILQHYYTGISLGTVPITAQAQMGIKTQFYAAAGKGVLHVESQNATTPIHVLLNGQDILLIPDDKGVILMDVGPRLQAGMLNTLELPPLPLGQQPVKAWIEIDPPMPVVNPLPIPGQA